MSTQLVAPDLKTAAFKLFKAAMEPDPLRNWARVVADVLGTQVASITVFCPNREAIANGTVSADLHKWELFRTEYQYCNPLREYWHGAEHGRTVRMDQIFECPTLRRGSFYSTFAEDLDRGRGICMSLNVRSARVVVSASRPVDRSVEVIDVTALQALKDDLKLACEISGTRAQSTVLIRNMLGTFEHKDIGAALLSSNGEVEETNTLFSRILDEGGMLMRDGTRLTLSPEVEPCGFAEALRRTARSSKSSRLPLVNRQGQALGQVIINPAPQLQPWEEPEPGKIVVLISETTQSRVSMGDKLSRQFGLTPVEQRVAGLLHSGKTSRIIAEELDIQPNTVRAHLKAIYAKTGTHSQVELLNFLRNDARQI